VEALGLGGTVRLLGRREDMPGLVRALDVAMLCSHPVVETFPLALVEALASGVPVVSTRVGSIADIVAEGESGFLAPPGGAQALAAAVARLLADSARRVAMGRCGRAQAENRFAEPDMVAAYTRLFAEVAGS
jgi:L-malate glycosyltransferase